MVGDAAGSTRRRRLRAVVPLVVPLVLAGALAGAAVVTVEQTPCDVPGHYATTAHGVTYLPGCLAPGGPLDRPHAPGGAAGSAADVRRG